jgi:nucleoid DNA-binding protein
LVILALTDIGTDYLKKISFMKKQTKLSPQLGSAYDLVIADLTNKLVKMKDGVIKLGDLGTLHKKQRVFTSSLNDRTYEYYRVSFKASKELKKELDK